MNNRHHEWPKKYAQFCLLQAALLRSQDTQGSSFSEHTRSGEQWPNVKNNSTCAWTHYIVSKKPLQNKETQVQVPMHTQLSRQTWAHNATKGSSDQFVLILSVHALKHSSIRSTPYSLLPWCIRSHHLITLHIPFGEQGTGASLACRPREWCRVSSKLKWTFLTNHQTHKSVAPLHTLTGSGGERWERVLNLITICSASHNSSLHI